MNRITTDFTKDENYILVCQDPAVSVLQDSQNLPDWLFKFHTFSITTCICLINRTIILSNARSMDR